MADSVSVPRTAGESSGALPNLVVIGAQKCGTTALNRYLDLHPEIAMSKPNELNFFIERRNWRRGLEWYRQQFDPAAPVRGDQSPNYSAYPHDLGVPERMGAVIPDARLIYMVRDPLERIAAHWVHNYAKHRERGSAAQTIMHPFTTYVIRSQYFAQLQRFLKHYDRSQILVLEQNDLLNQRCDTLREVFELLGVDPDFEHPGFSKLRHRTVRKRRLTRVEMVVRRVRRGDGVGSRLPDVIWSPVEIGSKAWRRAQRPIERPNIKEILEPEVLDVLREDAERLQDFTGRSFQHWSIWT